MLKSYPCCGMEIKSGKSYCQTQLLNFFCFQAMSHDSVRYSHQGDVFHYRWAARRCLELIYPKLVIEEIYIEGSKEDKLLSEYAIDVSEYCTGESKQHDQLYGFEV